MARPITPLPGHNTRPLPRLEWRNDHRERCSCMACVMKRSLKVRETGKRDALGVRL